MRPSRPDYVVDAKAGNPLKDVALHDTALTSVELALDRLMCTVEVEGSGGQMAEGERVVITCQGLHSFFASFNLAEMLDNDWPGNVQDGRYHENGIFRVYLTGGMLEAGAAALTLGDSAPLEHEAPGEGAHVVISGYQALYAVDFDFGFLEHLSVSPTLGAITAHVLMRVADPSSELVPAVLSFTGVKSCSLKLDVAAMKAPARFGSLRSLRMSVRSRTVWMYCSEGFVEVVADQVVLRRAG
ncbi:hypothetical protein PDM28_14870 [Stenotrophomonas aracearum]|jgi:hypothetical protein|uniref:Uncharacterized protein n=1 Tax=Stenotrophomonas aracearum TaxID=3003272 RepID=A0ABY9YB74_9GAMM|nr:hypothetical protein [Stenotrophomonas sp. A5588]WNH47947.1 hypothetical protein PDM28_14870 [Stenotrophomonas sp. A5588]